MDILILELLAFLFAHLDLQLPDVEISTLKVVEKSFLLEEV